MDAETKAPTESGSNRDQSVRNGRRLKGRWFLMIGRKFLGTASEFVVGGTSAATAESVAAVAGSTGAAGASADAIADATVAGASAADAAVTTGATAASGWSLILGLAEPTVCPTQLRNRRRSASGMVSRIAPVFFVWSVHTNSPEP